MIWPLIFSSTPPFLSPLQVKFLTPIYHPNVDESGANICLSMITAENWKPSTKAQHGAVGGKRGR